MPSIRKRTNADGSVSYRVDVRLKGFPPQRATFRRLTDAKRWGSHTEAAIREGRYFKTAEARKHSFSELVDRYLKGTLPTKSVASQKVQKPQLEWWGVQLGHYTLVDITPALITECRDSLLSGITARGAKRTPATVVRYMAVLGHAFTVAVNEWGWLENSPMSKVKKPKEPRGRVRFLSDDAIVNGEKNLGERTRLLKACRESGNPYLYPVVVLALSTGMRQGEIMGLKWDDVDFNLNRITLHKTKNDERRVVPLTGKALELLKEHNKIRRIDTPLLFPGKGSGQQPMDLRASWLSAIKQASIQDFKFHDLRHTAASYLAMNGASITEIAEILGHKTLQMVKRYAHLSEAHTASVVESMNKKIFG